MHLRTPPGRAGRPWLAQRLAIARRGADVLDQKRQGLLRERTRFATMFDEARVGWEQAARDAEEWLRRARLVAGQRSLDLATFYVPEPAELRLDWRRSLGVTFAADADVRLPLTPDHVAPGGGAALPAAAGAHGRAVEAAARYAAARSALERLDAELAATTRRLRALERRWIPAYAEALATLALELDEDERQDSIRARWFAKRQTA
jgi:V/A-type H+-transporting ATPase subunit D